MSDNPKPQVIDEEELSKTQTTSSANKRCAGCNGPLVYDPSIQKLKCEYCDAEYDIPQIIDKNEDVKIPEITAESPEDEGVTPAPQRVTRNRKGERPLALVEYASCKWGTEKKMVKCQVCGAQTIYDAAQTSSTCPYCDSNQMMEQDNADNAMAPTGICIFKVDRTTALAKFQEWVSSRWFAPSSLKKLASAGAINGVYLPYWTYDADADVRYNGEYGIDKKDKDGKTHTTWYKCSGRFKTFVDDFLQPAYKSKNAVILHNIEPFNTNDYEDYTPEYMAGYIAERYTVEIHDGWEKAQVALKSRMDALACDDIKKRHKKADRTRTSNVFPHYSDVAYKYLFLPIWISSYRFNGKVYQFVVNGQNGKVAGERPYSIWKILLLIAVIAGVLYFALRS